MELPSSVSISNSSAIDVYDSWLTPTCIVSDGAYGTGGFLTDPRTIDGLVGWYEPHIRKWTEKSTPSTTIWFWNTELGWAKVHTIFEKYGWLYNGCNIWNKGIGHIAGNVNTKTIGKFPQVTEVCVQYIKPPRFTVSGTDMDMGTWLRHEWKRSGLPYRAANTACGTKNAATRKYLASDEKWYMPPPEALDKMVNYVNQHGLESGKPYFSTDGENTINSRNKISVKHKFHCKFGVTNVWDVAPIRGKERIKINGKCVHPMQKPLAIMKMIVEASTDVGDCVWEPFGGLCTASVAAYQLGRVSFAAELDSNYCDVAASRFKLL